MRFPFVEIRLIKFAVTSAILILIWLTWRLVTGHLDWGLAIGSLAVSGLWLGITGLRLRQLLTNYFSFLSRLQVIVPLCIGVILSVVAVFSVHHWALFTAAFLEIAGWALVYRQYVKNRKLYINQGHGPLPADAWVNPPAGAIRPFDIVLFGGRMAERLHDSVGHGEIALEGPDGKMMSFTTYMEQGCLIQEMEAVTSKQLKKGHYIVLRLQHEVTPELITRAYEVALQMLADNIAWRDAANARRRALVSWLPLPASWKEWLFNRIRATGYDWVGLFSGARASNRWICVGACIELLERLGIKMARYGTGIMGLGTGLFDPIMPVRFLGDPTLRLLTGKDRVLWETSGTKVM